uniref:Uncharacterized protein n=1 Tax=Arundo donax TaxID=35708 RepID=A0A0A9GH21_ARUDO
MFWISKIIEHYFEKKNHYQLHMLLHLSKLQVSFGYKQGDITKAFEACSQKLSF